VKDKLEMMVQVSRLEQHSLGSWQQRS